MPMHFETPIPHQVGPCPMENWKDNTILLSQPFI